MSVAWWDPTTKATSTIAIAHHQAASLEVAIMWADWWENIVELTQRYLTVMLRVAVFRAIDPQYPSIRVNESTRVLNLTHPKVCIELWREGLMTVEDTLHCIDRYMGSRNQT